MDGLFNSMVHNALLPLNGEEPPADYATLREQDLAKLGGTSVDLLTCDDVRLDAIWSECTPGAATAVVFHSNATVLHHMVDIGQWYRQRGMNVLLMTIRGYAGSEGDAHADGELGLYKDVHAAVRFVFEQNVSADKVLLHGVSLGACLALDGAQRYGLRACVDQGFSTLHEVASRLMSGLSLNRIIDGVYPAGIEHELAEDLRISGCDKLVSDTFNNLAKIEGCAQNCFIICASDDEMAPSSDAQALFDAKYPEADEGFKSQYLVERPGRHMEPFMRYDVASTALENFLRSEGLIA